MLSSPFTWGWVVIYLKNMYIMHYIFLAIPVQHITYWLNAYSIITVFPITTFVKISKLGEDTVFNYISLTGSPAIFLLYQFLQDFLVSTLISI